MKLVKWDELPENMKNEEVKRCYEILEKKKLHLVLKRVFDVLASTILLVLLSPIMLLIAIAIKLTSKGPVFYRQTRVTQYGREFRIFKFRTMITDADKIGNQVTVGNDPRITNVGHKIRKLRLDEIPQLFNVLIGDMSFVGTRPEVPKYVKAYSPNMMATLLMPSGITSEASIRYKDEDLLLTNCKNVDETYIKEVLPGKMEFNINSIKEFSFIQDVKTMLKTGFIVFK